MQGKLVNGFELKKLIGSGGMAEVWLAENAIGKKVAVKLLLPKYCGDDAIVARFQNEAKVMVQLEHPHIRQVYDFGESDGRPYIVMEYLEGEDLKVLMKSRHFTDTELRNWWNQIVDALSYTHAEGIVHRDIKPSNIFLDKKGNIKLLDFGIAKIKESLSMTQTGTMMGTLMYMSPEQVEDSKHIGPQSDIYSLAVTFVHLLTGKTPYDSATSSDYAIRKGIVENPLDLSAVPADWRAFLAPYLEKKPENRPALRPFEIETEASKPAQHELDDETVLEGTGNAKPTGTEELSHDTLITDNFPNETEPQTPEPQNQPKSKKTLWIGLGVVAAIIALVVIGVKMKDSRGKDSIYSGFKKMENGAYMKFYTKGDSEMMPRLKDEATFEMTQYFNDSMLFTTVGDKPMSVVLTEADFVGDVVDGLLMMHVGDSARLVVPADSIFNIMLQMDEIPEEYAGKPIYYDLKLLSVKPFEVLEAEHKALLDSLKGEEEAFLTPLRDNPNNSMTESGIIVLEKTGKGKVAKMGEYVNFDFTMCSPKGDTIMNSFGVEPVEIQYGEEFISRGFNEAIGLVPEGGALRCVIPSALVFDSLGYEQFIQPYTPMVVTLKMNNVMDKAAYEKRLADEESKREAESNRLMALEAKSIADYIKVNGIMEAPTESGLYFLRQEEGEGHIAEWGDEVGVHYVLKNLKGEQLESSYDYNQPMYFKIGSGQMIPAIEEAVMTMAPGAKVTLLTPSSLAFGEYDLGATLPPYSPLLIELELVEIK